MDIVMILTMVSGFWKGFAFLTSVKYNKYTDLGSYATAVAHLHNCTVL